MDDRLQPVLDQLAACDLAELWAAQRWIAARIAEVEATQSPQAVAHARRVGHTVSQPVVSLDGSSHLIARLEAPVRDAVGTVYQVDVFGRRVGTTWFGWLVFTPLGDGPTLLTGTETTQPDRGALAYWAGGLEPIYLDGALARARRLADDLA